MMVVNVDVVSFSPSSNDFCYLLRNLLDDEEQVSLHSYLVRRSKDASTSKGKCREDRGDGVVVRRPAFGGALTRGPKTLTLGDDGCPTARYDFGDEGAIMLNLMVTRCCEVLKNRELLLDDRHRSSFACESYSHLSVAAIVRSAQRAFSAPR